MAVESQPTCPECGSGIIQHMGIVKHGEERVRCSVCGAESWVKEF